MILEQKRLMICNVSITQTNTYIHYTHVNHTTISYVIHNADSKYCAK